MAKAKGPFKPKEAEEAQPTLLEDTTDTVKEFADIITNCKKTLRPQWTKMLLENNMLFENNFKTKCIEKNIDIKEKKYGKS